LLHTKFWFIWPSGFREEDLQKSANQKQKLLMAAMFLNESEHNVQSLERAFYRCFLPNFDSFDQAVSEENIFLEISYKTCLWRQFLSTDKETRNACVNGPGRNEQSL